jgi:ubiquinone/menaquinone biosynthesis C-methylase UbiE
MGSLPMIHERVLELIAPLHRKYRTQKCEFFFKTFEPQPGDSMLDVGGGAGITGEFAALYRYFGEVHVVNLCAQSFEGGRFRNVQFAIADGCSLPFPDRSFDWVFSNAVIEHVGGRERQKQFAGEIQRVARKGYFVATPNRHFPIDPNTLLPFYQYLSPALQKKVCRFSPGYFRQYEPLDLLSRRDLRNLFPGSEVQMMGMTALPNNLVAYRRLHS